MDTNISFSNTNRINIVRLTAINRSKSTIREPRALYKLVQEPDVCDRLNNTSNYYTLLLRLFYSCKTFDKKSNKNGKKLVSSSNDDDDHNTHTEYITHTLVVVIDPKSFFLLF